MSQQKTRRPAAARWCPQVKRPGEHEGEQNSGQPTEPSGLDVFMCVPDKMISKVKAAHSTQSHTVETLPLRRSSGFLSKGRLLMCKTQILKTMT